MTTTPYDARRSMRIREASEKAYHLAHIIKDYPNHRRDGSQFGASQLDRIEKVLTETTEIVIEMANSEHKQLLDQRVDDTSPEPSLVAQDVVVAFDGSGATSVARPMEQTIPPSLLERIRNRTDCD